VCGPINTAILLDHSNTEPFSYLYSGNMCNMLFHCILKFNQFILSPKPIKGYEENIIPSSLFLYAQFLRYPLLQHTVPSLSQKTSTLYEESNK
jgi:hypothetical protein